MNNKLEQNETITLVTVCDNNLIMMLAALLKSIEDTHFTDEDIDIYIVDDNIAPRNKARLISSLKLNKINIIWKKLNHVFPSHIQLPLDNTTFPANVYARLCIPYFVDPSVEKVIYLDVDMILVSDISALWKIDLGTYNIAAVTDRCEVVSSNWGGILNYKELGLDPESKYLNAGMIVIKPQQWRKLKLTEQAFEVRNKNIDVMTWGDQYCMNVVFNNNWMELDKRWNSFAQQNIPDPYLIHFTGMKPIFSGYNGNESYKQLFFEYLDKTKWRGFKQKSNIIRFLQKLYNKSIKKIRQYFK